MHTTDLPRLRTAVTNGLMAKRRAGGAHKTPRQAVQIPVTWIAVARKIAIKRQQPMMWYLVSLLGDAAKKEGIELPKFPWDEDFIIDDGKSK